MNPVRKQRLLLVLFLALGSSLLVWLVLSALSENLNYFYPPSKIHEAPQGVSIRAGGCVVPGSVERASDSLQIDFVVTDNIASLAVRYNKILPALFAEGEAAVIKGKLNERGVLIASQVLAKHDENYVPAEISDSVKTDRSKDTEICKGLNYGT